MTVEIFPPAPKISFFASCIRNNIFLLHNQNNRDDHCDPNLDLSGKTTHTASVPQTVVHRGPQSKFFLLCGNYLPFEISQKTTTGTTSKHNGRDDENRNDASIGRSRVSVACLLVVLSASAAVRFAAVRAYGLAVDRAVRHQVIHGGTELKNRHNQGPKVN
eukprot:scaffold145_cov173-Amphora_coffeaeformis.AAC.2